MSTRKAFCAILSLFVFLGLCCVATVLSVPTDAALSGQGSHGDDAQKELMNQIRREKFDLVLPQIMRKHNIDMWIHVMREAIPDPFGENHLGSASGVFVFTDRGTDRIERAVIGLRWREGPTLSGLRSSMAHKLVEECGAYDIVGETTFQREMPGGPTSQYNLRFKDIGEFVAKRDPARIAVNYREKLGPSMGETSREGISHTDYILLTRALGAKFSERLVSSEYLIKEYLSKPVPSESKMDESAATARSRFRFRDPQVSGHEELVNKIRKEKFDDILPGVMRENKIDMWINVFRESNPDPLATDFGSTSGVFIFTDRGKKKIERAALGLRWKGKASDVVEECGDYDIVAAAIDRGELPGGPGAEYEQRFQGVGEFVAERDPERIALNYWETLGPPEDDSRWNDGISHTDYRLLVKALGEKYAERIVSAESLRVDYLARVVPSQIVLYTKMRQGMAKAVEKDFTKIVPGVTKIGEIEGGVSILVPEKGVLTKWTNPERVFKRGDLFIISHGARVGRFKELINEHGYVLREGETDAPSVIKKLWADGLKMRRVMEENTKVGRTAGETYKLLKEKLAEVGIIANDRQQYYKDLDPEKTQVGVDNHGLEEDPYPARIGPFGQDWMRDWTIPPIHHFVVEYFVYMALPSAKHEVKYLTLWFHDGAYVDEGGMKYFVPPPTELRLIR